VSVRAAEMEIQKKEFVEEALEDYLNRTEGANQVGEQHYKAIRSL
jgi:hypothetical protein